ncbi:MAG TPA: VCBS repeat-containing protein [Pyrinomonadaceae bacterium]|nr:VCBS repeat-containing protein [Pyrinomonadaceae bacterium]
MSWTKMTQSTHSLAYAFAVISLAAIGLWIGVHNNSAEANTTIASSIAAPAATFTGTGTGNIPDLPSGTTCQTAQGTPLNVTFNVTGITGNVSNVAISATGFHSWVGDITATLIAPNGASHSVFGRTGATTAGSSGDSSDFNGTYNFTDAAAAPPSGGWWQEATLQGAAVALTPGSYRTTASGGAGATNPMPATSMNPSFTGVANANGTWTLRLTDGCALDTGNISASVLTVVGAAVPTDANTDFNGDGKTDFVVARATTTPLSEATAPGLGPILRNVDSSSETKSRTGRDKTESVLAPPIYWYTSFNGSGTTGVGQLGDAATDFIVTEDFDGDLKDDLTVWTEAPATQANFKILQSSTNTIRVELFGQTGDDPAVVGDYDGDGKADPAVYRCPGAAAPDGQCYFYYRGSNANPSGNVTYVPWGFGVDGDFFPYVGDFDGDGKNDFCIQRANPSSPTNGQFILLRSSDLGIEYINWGLSSDFLIPGDYDGDGKTDLCVRRTVGGNRQHWILTRTGATSFANWGVTGDSSAPGDYDGDGKTDLAIWRGSSTPGDSRFWILNSSNSSVTQFTWGQCATVNTCDFAVAGWAVH